MYYNININQLEDIIKIGDIIIFIKVLVIDKC